MASRARWLFLPALLLPAPAPGADGPGPDPGFDRAAAVLVARCSECHNPTDRAGGLDLGSREGLIRGGENGPAVVAGDPSESFLLQRVFDGEMPPKSGGKDRALPPEEVEALRDWIAGGAAWPEGRVLDPFEATTDARAGRDFWSLRPVAPVEPPAVQATHLVANPVDAFLLEKLEARGWTFAPEADRRTLLRRLSFDLVGLPPTHEEIEAFARDETPDAYETVVDRLLASPHYGERWGRHWLDVARYADTCGYERDQEKPGAWKYRDWVIRAFNDDLPFDRFVLEQLAGDELPDRSEGPEVATGFLRLGTWNDEPNDPQEYKYERLEDMVHAAGTAFLAMTVKCARCHDHKFDPIRQDDYYRLAAAFWAGPIEPGPREQLGGPPPGLLGEGVLGWTDLGRDPPPFHLLRKGDPNRPGPVVEPGHLSMIPALDRPFEPPPPGAKTTHRRLQFARWVVDPANPLTARVWVNRVWQHHFGRGIVGSVDNFGFTGDRPTHPELLDWLAARFVAEGWRTKPLHRLLVMSRAYRQASIHPDQAAYERKDAGNDLRWRAERRRLDAEALRDALLAAAGRLDLDARGGPGFVPDLPPEALEGLSKKEEAWEPSPPDRQRRRSVYLFQKRGLPTPMMTVFDAPDTASPCGRRDSTLVAPQALALLNNPFVHEQSVALAGRVASAAPADEPAARARAAWRLALGREPSGSELGAAIEHLSRRPGADARALESLCHVLLNTNEFVYLD